MNSFVSVFVSGMSGQCQKYVANFEVMGIPPQTGAAPAKRKRILSAWGGFRFQKILSDFLPFSWALERVPVAVPCRPICARSVSRSFVPFHWDGVNFSGCQLFPVNNTKSSYVWVGIFCPFNFAGKLLISFHFAPVG